MVTSEDAFVPGLAPLWAAAPTEHVLGFPLLVAIDLTANRADVGLQGLPRPSLSSTLGAIGLDARDEGGLPRRLLSPCPSEDEDMASFGLGGHERRRFLLELSAFVEPLGLGTHQLTVSYAATWTETVAPPLPIRIRAPNLHESQQLDPVLADKGDRSWETWTYAPLGRVHDGDSIHPGLAYLQARRRLYAGPEPLAQLDPAPLDEVTGVAAPEAALLRAEISWARDRDPALSGYTTWIRQHLPGLVWWLDAILSDRSDIALHRKASGLP